MHTVGPYRIVDEIARGGHGVVYRAQDGEGHTVALKLLLAHRAQSAQARRRFQAEVNALARLRHPHVVQLVGAGEHEGCPWLALDYVEGESLEEHLRRGPLAIHAAIRVAQQLAQALSYVHSCGVLHRDLKPDNVLLRGDDVLLTDFGLVLDDQRAEQRITTTGVFQGTPGYWAPEQARGEVGAYGPATDVYGLGAVLYACLTGGAPVQADSLAEHLQTLRFKAVRPPRELRPEAPGWLSELCERCLAFEPARRPRSVDEVARALVVADGSAGSTDSPSPGPRIAAGLLAAGATAALAALGVWTLGTSGAADPEPQEPIASSTATPSGDAQASPTGDPARDDAAEREAAGAQAQRDAAYAALLAGGYVEAVAGYDRALQLDPTDTASWVHRGVSKARLGRHAEAIEDFNAALELDPDEVTAWTNRAASKTSLGHHAEAIEDCDRALELDPRRTSAWVNRGLSKANLGRYAEAIQDYDRALELAPGDASTWVNRGTSKLRLGRYAEGIADCDRALELDPDHATALTKRAAGKIKLRRYAEAVDDCERALKLDPRQVTAWSNLGLSTLELGRYREAVAAFDRALQFDLRPAWREQLKRQRAKAAAKLRGE